MRRLPHVSLILGMAFFMAADDVKKPETYSGVQDVDDESKQPQQEEKRLLLGPFPLGDHFAKVKCYQESLEYFGKGNVPSEDKIVKALNRCQFYIFDQSTRHDNGSWDFKKTKKGSACVIVLVEGELRHALQDSNGRAFTIQISKATVQDIHTEATDRPWRRTRVFMHMILNSKSANDGSDISWLIESKNFALWYDVHGKPVKPDGKPVKPEVRRAK